MVSRNVTIHTGFVQRIAPGPFGSTLLLDNGHSVRLNLTPTDLRQFLTRAGLVDLCDEPPWPSIRIANPELRMTAREWAIISSVLKSSDVAAEIQANPELANALTLTYDELIELPSRVLGKIQEPDGHGARTLWVQHPFDFRGDSYDDNALMFCHLYASGGQVFRTFIDLNSTAIRIKAFHCKGFFIDPQSETAA